MQMYLIENDHEAIISKEDFEAAQRIMGYRGANRHSGRKYPFSGKIVCGDCGGVFLRRVESGEVFWICGNHIKQKSCGQALGGKIREKDIQQAFMRLCGKLKQNKRILEDMCGRFAEMEAVLRQSGSSPDIMNKIAGLEKQEQVLDQMLMVGYLDPAFYIPEKNRIKAEREELEVMLDNSGNGISMWEYAERTKKIISALPHRMEFPGEFDEALFGQIVETAVIHSTSEVEFRLANGLCAKEGIR